MSWTPEQLKSHKRHKSLVVGTELDEAKVTKVTLPQQPAKALVVPKEKSMSFEVPGPPMGKPRMTRRDKWQKRPAVLRYRDYCDRCRAAAPIGWPGGPGSPYSPYGIIIQAFIAMPDSWSNKKKAQYHGTAHQSKPDFDNIIKSVCDALFKEDSILAGGTCWKYWCYAGEERTKVRVLYDD